MARYVDGFVLPVPKKNLQAYRRMAQKAGRVWRDHGALEFRECVADDVKVGKWTSFPRSVKRKPSETVVFSYIVYKSRAHRDSVNESDEGQAPREDDAAGDDAVRRQTHDLWRLQGASGRVKRRLFLRRQELQHLGVERLLIVALHGMGGAGNRDQRQDRLVASLHAGHRRTIARRAALAGQQQGRD